MKQLQARAKQHGYNVNTFSTHGPNFYEDAVLYVAVGNPANRNSPLVLETWDVSYSIGRPKTGNNKWARALTQAENWIAENPDAPNENKLMSAHQSILRHRRNRKRREKTALRRKNISELTPTTLREVLHKLSPEQLKSFGTDEAEREELLDAPDIVAWRINEITGGKILLVKQITLPHGPGWYRISHNTTNPPVIQL
jgi:hypothetical protein